MQAHRATEVKKEEQKGEAKKAEEKKAQVQKHQVQDQAKNEMREKIKKIWEEDEKINNMHKWNLGLLGGGVVLAILLLVFLESWLRRYGPCSAVDEEDMSERTALLLE